MGPCEFKAILVHKVSSRLGPHSDTLSQKTKQTNPTEVFSCLFATHEYKHWSSIIQEETGFLFLKTISQDASFCKVK